MLVMYIRPVHRCKCGYARGHWVSNWTGPRMMTSAPPARWVHNQPRRVQNMV